MRYTTLDHKMFNNCASIYYIDTLYIGHSEFVMYLIHAVELNYIKLTLDINF